MSKRARRFVLATVAALGAMSAIPLDAIACRGKEEDQCLPEDYCLWTQPDGPCYSVAALSGIPFSQWTTKQKKSLQGNLRKFDKGVSITGKHDDPLTLKLLKDKVGPSFDVNKTPGKTILQSLK